MVEMRGIEPLFTRCQRVVLPLNDIPMVDRPGIEPGSLRCERSVFPFDDQPIVQEHMQRGRTLHVPSASREGIEPSSRDLEFLLRPSLRLMERTLAVG